MNCPDRTIGRHMLATSAGGSWQITTRRTGALLGTVEWHEKWRQFEFVPQFGTAYTWDCLVALGAFLQDLNGTSRAKAGGSAR